MPGELPQPSDSRTITQPDFLMVAVKRSVKLRSLQFIMLLEKYFTNCSPDCDVKLKFPAEQTPYCLHLQDNCSSVFLLFYFFMFKLNWGCQWTNLPGVQRVS